MARNLLAVLIGVLAGMAFNMAVVQFNATVLYPMPEGLDMQDTEAFNAYLATLPSTAFLVTMVAHLGQAVIAAFIASRFCATMPLRLAMIVGFFSLLGGIAALQMFDGPGWMSVELPFYLALPWLIGLLEEKRRAKLGGTADPGLSPFSRHNL